MSIRQLREMSNKYGANPEYVLAGGGNTSYKQDNIIYVKGSGMSLADITEDGFVKMYRDSLDAIFSKEYSSDTDLREQQVLKDMMDARFAGEESKRPSVEALLHNVFPFPFVLHIHAARVNGMTCGVDGKKFFDEYFLNDSVWIEPIMPGYILSKKVREKIGEFTVENNTPPRFIFLENHGVFVGGETLKEIDTVTLDLLSRIDNLISSSPNFSDFNIDINSHDEMIKILKNTYKCVNFTSNSELINFTQNESAFISAYTSFTPDHIVYCKDKTLFLHDISEADEKIKNFAVENNGPPKIIGLLNSGFFTCCDSENEASTVQAVFLDAIKIAVYAKNFGGGKPMPKDLIYAINNWEVERYRKSVSVKNEN